MALSVSHQVMLSVSLALCVCVLMPRIFGGGTTKPEPRRSPQPFLQRESHGKDHLQRGGSEGKTYSNIQQMRNVVEQELKTEKTSGSGRSMAFTLMPLYAIGVAVFAAYKFTKIKKKEKSLSKREKQADENKTKETENQLLELEHHLVQTEQMLNSLLTQLDPISNCVNTLANEQRDEIMNQLQSIRQLMKKSGIDKSASSNPANQICKDTLEDLIHSFKEPESDVCDRDEDGKQSEEQLSDAEETDIIQYKHSTEELDLQTPENSTIVEDSDDVTSKQKCDGLRRRNIKE
ncbi:hypothetical protein FKM82_012635 [Ascaphus truei]|uniref:uncharacterized protein LOC142495147 n=1 Tax=Ascaphus truei TaxID=8439 RepID=UPI003F5983FA